MIDGSPRLTWNFSDCSVALRFVFLTQQQRLNCVDVIISTYTALCLPLPGRLSTVPNFTSSLLVLFFVQPLVRNSVINCYNLYILADFWLKFCLLYWAMSKLPHLLDTVLKLALFSVSDLNDEKLIKSKPTWKLKHTNSILETFEYFCKISSKSILIISSHTVSKLGRFLRHSVDENIFTVAPPVNNQNDCVYVLRLPRCDVAANQLLRTRLTLSKSLMVSTAVSKLGYSGLVFVDPGTKINGSQYPYELLLKTLLSAIR